MSPHPIFITKSFPYALDFLVCVCLVRVLVLRLIFKFCSPLLFSSSYGFHHFRTPHSTYLWIQTFRLLCFHGLGLNQEHISYRLSCSYCGQWNNVCFKLSVKMDMLDHMTCAFSNPFQCHCLYLKLLLCY